MNVTKNLTTLQRVKVQLRIPALDLASGSLALSGVVASNPCTVAGVTFVAGSDYTVGGTDSATAANLATALNDNATVSGVLTALADGATIDLTAKVPGVVGNQIPLVGSTHITATAMSGGEGTQSTSDAADDEELNNLIASASADFAEAVGFDPNEQEATWTADFTGSDMGSSSFFLPDVPNLLVTAVVLNDETIDEAEDPNSAGWWQAGKHELRLYDATYLSYNHLEVTYTYGFDEMPEDIINAVTLMVATAWRMRDHLGERSWASPEGMSMTFVSDSFNADGTQSSVVSKTIARYSRLF